VLLFSTVFPNAAQPHHGVFVRERLRGLPPEEFEVRVVAPTPWFPFVSGLRPGLRPAVPREEVQDGVPVLHPRFLSFPAFFKCLDGVLLFLSTLPALLRLRREFRFEVIDAHFVYPEGLAAVLAGRVLRVPVTVTLRGMLPLLVPFRLRRPQLRFALRRASRLVAVSESLKRDAVALGIHPERVRVIANGIDPGLFHPADRIEARRRLGLAEHGLLLLSVGTLAPRKGFHLVMEAMAELEERRPTLRFAVVGGDGAEGAMAARLRQLASRLHVEDRVIFAGPRERGELAAWYSAADLFVLATAHEGCPNVVLEALACGTPVVATPAGSIPELIDPAVGVIVERTVGSIAAGIDAALVRGWDRDIIRGRIAPRTWQAVGREVAEELHAAVDPHPQPLSHQRERGERNRAGAGFLPPPLAGEGRGGGPPAGGGAMRILYHHRTRAGDAQGIHIAEMQRAFRLRGHDVREVALVEAGAEARADGSGGEARGLAGLAARAAARLPLPVKEAMELAYNAVAYRRLSRAIRELQPDFVYERYTANTFAGLAAARRHGVPFVLEVNAPLALEKERYGGLFFRNLTRRIERRLCAGADVTIAVTRVLARVLEEEGVPAGKAVVMPNGVRREFGKNGDGVAFRRALGVPLDVPVAGFVGWFRAWHGLERLMEAAASPAWREARVHLVLAGDGPAMPMLREMREASPDLERRVVLCGPVPRDGIESALASFDVAVQPAVTSYACPMKILEYMAAGRAIVAPGSANVRELLTHAETALLCPGDENPAAEDLGAAVLTLVRDPALRARLGEAARARVFEQGYLWDENARRVEELVAQVHERAAAAAAVPGREVQSC
jgi:glycosyltransferase involved in cell wall biosynthesis